MPAVRFVAVEAVIAASKSATPGRLTFLATLLRPLHLIAEWLR
jgi:hypothetical protein